MMNDPSQMMNRPYGMWQPQGQAALPPLPAALAVAEEPMGFVQPRPVFSPSARINWQNKNTAGKRKNAAASAAPGVVSTAGLAGVSGYKPPSVNDLQYQNRVKSRRIYPKKKFSRFAPFAPRNTTSYIIRAKQSGGIASLVSPYPVTPAILPTPTFSPLTERLGDMAKEEWGVDGYGSMKDLIRPRSPNAGGGLGAGWLEDDDDVEEDGSSESDVEEHVEVERRLDHDLSRFEIVYPSSGEEHGGAAAASSCLLENRVDDQDTHIAHLEEENFTLKERIFLMESELGELRRRLLLLETDYRSRNGRDDDNNNTDHGEGNANLNGKEASENDGGGDVGYEESSGVRMHEQ